MHESGRRKVQEGLLRRDSGNPHGTAQTQLHCGELPRMQSGSGPCLNLMQHWGHLDSNRKERERANPGGVARLLCCEVTLPPAAGPGGVTSDSEVMCW